MTTIKRAVPLPARLRALGSYLRSAGRRRVNLAFLRGLGRNRALHELDDRMLHDIGLEREDVMSPEARRTMIRLNAHNLW